MKTGREKQWSELLAVAKIPYAGPERAVNLVTADSRKAKRGSVFVCIRGFREDGHDHAVEAYKQGCRCFVSEKGLPLPQDASAVLVPDTRKALAMLCHAFFDFPAEKLSIVGITGTKGKTTTAKMLCAILTQSGIPTGYIGTNGIDYAGIHLETGNTTPDSERLASALFDMGERGIRAVVLEVSSQALFLDRVAGIPFFATAFTNLSPDHIGDTEHPNFAHYRDCKRKLFSVCPSGYAVFCADDPYAGYMQSGCNAVCSTFGLENGDYRAENLTPTTENGVPETSFLLTHGKESAQIKLPFAGEYNVRNALCAAALAERFGVSLPQIASGLARVSVPGRSEVVKTGSGATFVIDYAHNGVSMENILKTMRNYTENELWCVVGSVGGRTEVRRKEIGKAVSLYCDRAVLTSDNPDAEDPVSICEEIKSGFAKDIPCVIIPDREAAIRFCLANAKKGDLVVLAGKGHEKYQLVRGKNLPFSEKSILKDK